MLRTYLTRTTMLMMALVSFLPIDSAMAAGFSAPPPTTNRQKAHLNISFTGGGTTSTGNNGSSCTGSTDVTGDFSLGTDPKERRVNLIKAFMSTYGLTAEQAAGPVGNFMWESGGVQVPPDINQGETAGAPPNSSALGYGWAQWSGSRKTAFVTFMKANQFVTSDGRATDAADFNYLKKELNDSYKDTMIQLKKQTTPEDAALSFEATFEHADPVTANLPTRKTNARQAFTEYTADSGGAGGGQSAGCAGTSESANFGTVAFPLKGSKKVVNNPTIFKNGTTDTAAHPYIAYDILANTGTEVVAFASGVVSHESSDRCGGKFITIWNEQAKLGVTYMHMSDHIAVNANVKPGDHVGTVGTVADGCSVAHLHIDVATDKIRQDCSRLGCSIQDHFRSIGKELFDTYEALPDN